MMDGEGSIGALVPSVKSEPRTISAPEAAGAVVCAPTGTLMAVEEVGREAGGGDGDGGEIDKDFVCPICMQIMKDAFLTACGHSYCYMCIITHLKNKNDCPCCGNYLAGNQLFPNFVLNKLLKKTSARQVAKTASPTEHLRYALQQGYDVSVKEINSLLSLLTDKKRKKEQEEAESNMLILLEFLHRLRKQKVEELTEIQNDLQYIKEDITSVERHRMELYRTRERYTLKLRMLLNDPAAINGWPSLTDKQSGGPMSSARSAQGGIGPSNLQNQKIDVKPTTSSQGPQRKDACSGSDPQSGNLSGLVVARKRRIHTQFNDLLECYLQKRRTSASQANNTEERDINAVKREGYHEGLEDFQSVLSTFTRYSRLRVIAELRHGDLFHSANIVSSIEFDRDDELFATAGVSRRIKVFEFSSVVNGPPESHFPLVEMTTRSKLSCLSWNKFIKNQIVSSDYEGIVNVWDVSTRQSVMEYEEHEKRAWSVDFSRNEPTMLVSGSDDCKVKIWTTRQEASVINIDMKANVCSVKFNPGSSFYVAVGSADHQIHYYDLRNISAPLHVFGGHRKAVSYVKFLSNNDLASASTDSTLRLWDVKENSATRVFRGHTNEKNFVGLSVNKQYMACGSETNEVFVYHKAISKPATTHKFASADPDDPDDDIGYFISAVCWKSDTPTLLTANSQGTIKVLVLAA